MQPLRSCVDMRVLAALMALVLPGCAAAEGVAVNRVIRAGSVLEAGDLMQARAVAGGLRDATQVIGREARVTLYAGRPLRAADLGAPALVERNQNITLIFRRSGLSMHAEGRALARGGAGDVIRVMNLHSRTTITGVVQSDGSVVAGGG